MKKVSKTTAKKILDEGTFLGKKLSRTQIAFYRLIVSGDAPTRLNDIPVEDRKRIAA